MNIRTSAFRGLAILSLTVLGMAACEDKDVINIPEEPAPAVEVTVVPSQVTIPVGGTAAAAAVVKNSANQSVNWATGAATIATVSSAGVITGVAPGSTVITATSAADATAKGVVSVTVTAPVYTVSVLPSSATLNKGATLQLAANVSGGPTQTVNWTTSASAVATVVGGLVTAVNPGTAVITATSTADANAKASSVITVVDPGSPVKITMLPATATILVGGNVQLVPNVTGTTNTAVTYVSSSTTVATVTAGGLVEGKAEGTAVITATSTADPNQKATAVITVNPKPPVGITLTPAEVTIDIDKTVKLVATVSNATNTAATFETSDATVATVAADGTVTGKAAGTAVITATAAADPTKKATATVTVKPAPPAASISIASVVDHEYGAPVDPDHIQRQIDVTVNVSAVPENGVRAVAVWVDDLQVCRQNFTTPLGTTQGVATINCPVNTAEWDMETFLPKFLNGEHVIRASAMDENDGLITVAEFCPVGGDCAVTFDNHDFVADIWVDSFEKTVDDWNAGEVVVHVGFVKYSLEEVDYFAGRFFGDCDYNGGPSLFEPQASSNGWWDEFELEPFENGIWTGTTSAGDVTSDEACVGVGYMEYAGGAERYYDEFTDEFQYDTEAPYMSSAPSVGSGIYYNDAKTFTAAANDAGVGGEDPNTKLWFFTTPGNAVAEEGVAGASITTDGLAETPLNNGYTIKVSVADALGNSAVYGNYGNFGIDFTEPTVTFKWFYDGDPIDTGETMNNLDYSVDFDIEYIDAATPPAGPSGFAQNPVSYRINRYNAAGTSTGTWTSVNEDFSLPATGTDGYYTVNATVYDAAGNYVQMPEFVILIDDTPPNAGNLTVPSVLTGGTAYSLSAQISDNVELGTAFATMGYFNEADIVGYWIIQNEKTFSSYGLPLEAYNTTYGTVEIPSVIRSVRQVGADGLPSSMVWVARWAEYAVRDVAGDELEDVCPMAHFAAADDETTVNCRVRKLDITAGYNMGNPSGTIPSFTVTGLLGNTTVGASGFIMDTNTPAVDAIATGAAQTFNNPFSGVYFYWLDASNRAHYLGQGSVSVTDDTNLQIRTWRYKIANSWWPDADDVMGVFAMVRGSNGDVLVTRTELNPNEPPPAP